MLSVALKLERHARSELRVLVAARAVRQAAGTAQFVLAHTAVSAEARARLAQVAGDRDAPAVVHRTAWLSYVMITGLLTDHRDELLGLMSSELHLRQDWMVRLLNGARPLWLLPNRSLNLMAHFAASAEQQMLAPGTTAGDE